MSIKKNNILGMHFILSDFHTKHRIGIGNSIIYIILNLTYYLRSPINAQFCFSLKSKKSIAQSPLNYGPETLVRPLPKIYIKLRIFTYTFENIGKRTFIENF